MAYGGSKKWFSLDHFVTRKIQDEDNLLGELYKAAKSPQNPIKGDIHILVIRNKPAAKGGEERAFDLNCPNCGGTLSRINRRAEALDCPTKSGVCRSVSFSVEDGSVISKSKEGIQGSKEGPRPLQMYQVRKVPGTENGVKKIFCEILVDKDFEHTH